MNAVLRKSTNANSAPKANLNLCNFSHKWNYESWMKSLNLSICKSTMYTRLVSELKSFHIHIAIRLTAPVSLCNYLCKLSCVNCYKFASLETILHQILSAIFKCITILIKLIQFLFDWNQFHTNIVINVC